jgi:glutamyl-tRNA synthetase
VVVNTNTLDDKVLFKSDGMPTYHLANVVDDHEMKVSHVIRGEEWLPSAPLHVLLYRFLGWEAEMPQFAHLPLLLKPDGNGKLSKRDGDRLGFPVFPLHWTDPVSGEVSSGYKEAGYLPDAFINFLAFLGWNPGTEQEIFDLGELANSFSLDRVNKAGAKFDIEKAKWFNQHYLKEKDEATLGALLKIQLDDAGISYPSDDYVNKAAHLVRERIIFIGDLLPQAAFFFKEPASYDAETIKKRWKPETPEIIEKLRLVFENTDFSSPEVIEAAFKKYLEDNQVNTGAALSPLRLVITGLAGGPGMFDIMFLIGKEATLNRMKTYTFNQ